jgi:hypothetical protein
VWVLSCPMTEPSIRREAAEYRGYSLQVTFDRPQWQVIIAPLLLDRPQLAAGKQTVKGWDEDETVKRAKMRIDLLIESPSLN